MTGSEAQPHSSAQLPTGRHTCRANTVSGQRSRPISFILGSASRQVGSDRTPAPCSGNSQAQPLDRHGSPWRVTQFSCRQDRTAKPHRQLQSHSLDFPAGRQLCSPGVVGPGEAIGEEEASPHEGPPDQGEDQGPGALLLLSLTAAGRGAFWGRERG